MSDHMIELTYRDTGHKFYADPAEIVLIEPRGGLSSRPWTEIALRGVERPRGCQEAAETVRDRVERALANRNGGSDV
jgi:hypothetical protein